PQNDALGKFLPRDLHGSRCALRSVGRGVCQYRVRDLVFFKKTLQTGRNAHGRTPFALCIGRIIARRKTKRNMYPASPDLKRELDSANHSLSLPRARILRILSWLDTPRSRTRRSRS